MPIAAEHTEDGHGFASSAGAVTRTVGHAVRGGIHTAEEALHGVQRMGSAAGHALLDGMHTAASASGRITSGFARVAPSGTASRSVSPDAVETTAGGSDYRLLEVMDRLNGVAWGVPATTCIILHGELHVERIDGKHLTLGAGSTFCTPLPAELGTLALEKTTCVVSAWAAAAAGSDGKRDETPCVLMKLDMDEMKICLLYTSPSPRDS